jgi:hypothetical protein
MGVRTELGMYVLGQLAGVHVLAATHAQGKAKIAEAGCAAVCSS